MGFKYRIYNAPSKKCINLGARAGMNWALVHSIGLLPGCYDHLLYYPDYPKVCRRRKKKEAGWIEKERRTVRSLARYAKKKGMGAAVHLYEAVFPDEFGKLYPKLVPVWNRPTHYGILKIPSKVDISRRDVQNLYLAKYRELAEAVPEMGMCVVTTWDGDGAWLCVAKSKMPVHERLAMLMKCVKEGLHSVNKNIIPVFRLWGRNWPVRMYREFFKTADKLTGRKDSAKLLMQILKPSNNPDVVLPKLFKLLPPDMPIMFKSTPCDMGANQDLTPFLKKLPEEREMIMEVSFENGNMRETPDIVAEHISKGVRAACRYRLAGIVGLPVQMGNNDRTFDPVAGCLGRMNWWLFERRMKRDRRSDRALVSAYLKREFRTAPKCVVDALLDEQRIYGEGVARLFSLYNYQIYGASGGLRNPRFPANFIPTPKNVERIVRIKERAVRDAEKHLGKIRRAERKIPKRLYEEMVAGYETLRGLISITRHWHSFLMLEWAIMEKKIPANRKNVTRMERAAEFFIRELLDSEGTPIYEMVKSGVAFPDPFLPWHK